MLLYNPSTAIPGNNDLFCSGVLLSHIVEQVAFSPFLVFTASPRSSSPFIPRADSDEQSPSLLVFIENKSKAMAIKELAKTCSPPPRYGRDPSCQSRHNDESSSRGQTKLNSGRARGEIYLHIHAPSTFSSRPVLLAEGDLLSLDKPRRALATEKCHETASRQLNSMTPVAPTLSESANRAYFFI
jgi:hypothetical protein